MKIITMLDFRNNSGQVLDWARQGLPMLMTYRGKPVMRLEPVREQTHSADDPFYHLADMAVKGGKMSNHAIDKIIYDA